MRPSRVALKDFNGAPITLGDSPENWLCLNPDAETDNILVLGPGPRGAPPFMKNDAFLWMEDDSVLAQLKTLPGYAPPPEHNRLADLAALPEGLYKIYFFRQGERLAPDYWGPILAALNLRIAKSPAISNQTTAWLPGNAGQLLHQELARTLKEKGFPRIEERVFSNEKDFLAATLPAFALSVNFRGLDPAGRIFHLLGELNIPLAIWLVDNPWHLLSSLRLPWWKKANLFVTDPGFIPGLTAYGAEHARFCPLAAAPHMFRASQWSPENTPVFVGRAAFPDREAFFGKAPIAKDLFDEAAAMLAAGSPPDYHWWSERCGQKLWPGMAGRVPGKGADYFSALNRAAWLKAIKPLRVIGDERWRALLPHCDLHPPVDYYMALPEIYAQAGCVLNVTSLLLPQSLNQRHFDVWAAGVPMLGDATQGLNIFPRDLAAPVTLASPGEFGEKWQALKTHPASTCELIAAWQDLLRRDHLYGNRLDFIMGEVMK